MNQAFYEIHRVINFYSPKRIILGQNVVGKVGEEAKALGSRRAIIVTDPGIVSAGYAKVVEDSLREKQIEFGLFDQVEPEPPAGLVAKCSQMIREGKYDLVIGVGGGSSLDVAKGASLMVTNPGTILDYAGMEMVPKPGLPKILIPTTAGTGSEVTRVFVLTDERDQTKKTIGSTFAVPEVAILDPMLTLSMPPHITANTGMDALDHAIESYVSAITTPYAEILAIEAISLIAHNLPLAYSKEIGRASCRERV